MLSVRRRGSCPLDYSKCNQTVTVYHQVKPGKYTRLVYDRAFLDFRKNRNMDKTGSRESNSFLLIVPGDGVSISPGDKALLGAGPVVNTREEWAALIPAQVAGLVVVKYVDPKYWQGRQCHVEAGG